MAYTSPIAWSDVNNAIIAWLARATGLTCVWEDQPTPQPARPYISCRWLNGPTRTGRDHHGTETDLTRASDVTITPVASNSTTYTVSIDGTPYQFVSDADATVPEITAGLCAAMAADPVVDCTDNGTDFDIQAKTTGTVFLLIVSDDGGGDPLLTWVNNDLGHEVQITVGGPRTVTLSVNVWADQSDVDAGIGAAHYMSIIDGSVNVPDELEARIAVGLGFHGTSGVQNLSGLGGTEIVDRRQMDVFLSVPYNLNVDRGYVDIVDAEVTVDDFPPFNVTLGTV